MTFWPALDILFVFAVLMFAGSFLGRHFNNWFLVCPAVLVMVGAVVLLVSSVFQLRLILNIDWSKKVVQIQSELARIRVAKLHQFKWTILLSPLVGFCLLLIGLQTLLDGLETKHLILDKLNWQWVIANYAFGVLFIFFGQTMFGFIAKRFGNQAWLQSIYDGIAGSGINRAEQEISRWVNYDCAAPDAINVDQ